MLKVIKFSLCVLLLVVFWKYATADVRKVAVGDSKNMSHKMISDAIRIMKEAVKTNNPKQYISDYFRKNYSDDGIHSWICEEYSGESPIPEGSEKYINLSVRSIHKVTTYILYAMQY